MASTGRSRSEDALDWKGIKNEKESFLREENYM